MSAVVIVDDMFWVMIPETSTLIQKEHGAETLNKFTLVLNFDHLYNPPSSCA